MKINSIKNYNTAEYAAKKHVFGSFPALKTAFKGASENTIKHDFENPIRKSMEQLDVFKASFIAGLGFGARALYYVFDDTDLLETTITAGQKLAKRNYKDAKGLKLAALGFASWAAIAIGIVGAIAAIYALYNAPKSMYQGKINAHKKSEEMDLYLGQHKIEKDLYDEVSKQAKSARTTEELNKAKSQYAMLRMAKNEAPAFAQFQTTA